MNRWSTNRHPAAIIFGILWLVVAAADAKGVEARAPRPGVARDDHAQHRVPVDLQVQSGDLLANNRLRFEDVQWEGGTGLLQRIVFVLKVVPHRRQIDACVRMEHHLERLLRKLSLLELPEAVQQQQEVGNVGGVESDSLLDVAHVVGVSPVRHNKTHTCRRLQLL